MRLFVAAALPGPAREALAGLGRAAVAAGGWRAVPDASLHLTLAFLGERPDAEAPAVADAVAGSVRPCGPVALGSPILLPRRAPRVAAVELRDPDGDLGRLQAAVSAALVGIGAYRAEARPWLPHVTVARRTRDPRGEVPPLPGPDPGAFRVPEVRLYRSRLSRTGARYEALAAVPVPER